MCNELHTFAVGKALRLSSVKGWENALKKGVKGLKIGCWKEALEKRGKWVNKVPISLHPVQVRHIFTGANEQMGHPDEMATSTDLR